MKAFDKKQFSTLKASVQKSGKTLAANVQSLIEMGLSQYQADGNSEYLTQAVMACSGSRAVKAEDVKAYITRHANVRWVAPKDETPRFKKKGKGVEVREPATPWYEASQNSKVREDKDVLAMVMRMRNSVMNALKSEEEGKRVAEGQSAFASEVEFALAKLEEMALDMGIEPAKKAGK